MSDALLPLGGDFPFPSTLPSTTSFKACLLSFVDFNGAAVLAAVELSSMPLYR